METRRLGYFVEIVNAGSISKAAAKIGVAQAALSQQLSVLENEFRCRLLNRTPTGVQVTPAGQALYREAQAILRQLDNARVIVRQQSGEISGVVSVGLSTSNAQLIAVRLLQDTQRLFPKITLQLMESMSGDMTERIVNGQLDIATLAHCEKRGGVLSTPLFMEELFVMSRVDRDLGESVTLEQLGELPLLVPSGRNTLRELYDAMFTQAGAQPLIAAEIDSVFVSKEAVLSGIGVAILPKCVWRDAIDAGQIRASRLADYQLHRTVWLARTKPRSSDAVEAVYGVVQRTFEATLRQLPPDHGMRLLID